MKKLALLLGLTVLGFGAKVKASTLQGKIIQAVFSGHTQPRGWGLDVLAHDVGEVFLNSVVGGYAYDAVVNEQRFKLGSQVLAYKFLAIQPSLSYHPVAPNNVLDFEIVFPIRWEKIPLDWAGEREVGDLFGGMATPGRGQLTVRPFFTQNVSNGHFGAGISTNLEW